eukprot:IDg22997t1
MDGREKWYSMIHKEYSGDLDRMAVMWGIVIDATSFPQPVELCQVQPYTVTAGGEK